MSNETSFPYAQLAVIDQRHPVAKALSKTMAISALALLNPAAGAADDLKNATATVASIVTWSTSSLKGAGITKLSAAGAPARAVTFTTAGITPADAPANVVITGLDADGNTISETLVLAQIADVVTSVKCYSSITTCVFPAADGVGATIAMGIADKFGMPTKLKSRAGAPIVLAEFEDASPVGTGGAAATATNQTTSTGLTVANATTSTGLTVGNSTVSVARHWSVLAPAAKAVDDTHLAYNSNEAANLFPGPITAPDFPRNIIMTFEALWDGGDVTVVGTDQFDAAVTEVIADNPGAAVVGVKIFKTITSITKELVGAVAKYCKVGRGDKLGLGWTLTVASGIGYVTGAPEAMTWDATYHGVTPTSLPNGARNYDLLSMATHTHAATVTEVAHGHAATVTEVAHGHTQNSHTHTGAVTEGTFALPAASAPYGAYTPTTTPNGAHDYVVVYERDVA